MPSFLLLRTAVVDASVVAALAAGPVVAVAAESTGTVAAALYQVSELAAAA